MVYEYQGTIITVRPGLGINNYATCKLKPSGSWTTDKSPSMPRTEKMDEAINNLHAWAEKKGLRRADCGCCYHQSIHLDPICKKYNQQLKTVEVVIFGSVPMRCAECDEHETKSLKRKVKA